MREELFDTMSYRLAPSDGGQLAYEWKDKPHRLVYDLCDEVERLQLLLLERTDIRARLIAEPPKSGFTTGFEFIAQRIAKINKLYKDRLKED